MKINFWKILTGIDKEPLQTNTQPEHNLTAAPLPAEMNATLPLAIDSCRVVGPHDFTAAYAIFDPQVWERYEEGIAGPGLRFVLKHEIDGIDIPVINIEQIDENSGDNGGWASDQKMTQKVVKWSNEQSDKYVKSTYTAEFTVLFNTTGGQKLEFLGRDKITEYMPGDGRPNTYTYTREVRRATQNSTITITYSNYKDRWSEKIWQQILTGFRIDGTFKRFQ